jgi:hypothetical protein
MPDEEHLTFVLHGENGIVSIESFVEAVRRVSELVQDVHQAVTKSRTRRTWIVERLQSSEPTITLRPAAVSAFPVVPVIVEGLRQVTAGGDIPSLPPSFGEDALEEVGRMGHVLARGRLVGISFYSDGATSVQPAVEIDDHISDQVARVLRAGYADIGTIEGSLGAIQTHRGRYFTVWDDASGAAVRCNLPRERWWTEKVTGLLESRVAVTGLVRYFGNGVPRSVVPEDVSDLVPHDAGAKATFGSIPDIIGDEDAVSYIRRMRD